MSNCNVAISYARFSSTAQADGDSLRRQKEDAEQYANANNLVIDKNLSFLDLGVSAYDQSNIRHGALGVFLKAIDAGKVPIGATLIVESFDRLSRAKPLDALGVFSDIISSGLNVAVLTKPPKVFSQASIDQNNFQLFEALIEMFRAHGESKRKSELVRAAWGAKKKAARAGVLMTHKVPHWISVQPDNTRVLIPERAAVILKIIEDSENGVGAHTIIRALHAEGVLGWSRTLKWQPSYIQKLLTSPALYGGINIDGEVVPSYYPPVITEDRFIALQAIRSARGTTVNQNRKGSALTNIFSGMLKCGYCGSAMNVAGYKSRVSGYDRKYVGCHGARINKAQCSMKIWFLDELEPSLLFWLASLDFNKVLGSRVQSTLDVEQTALTVLEAKLSSAVQAATNIEDAIAEGAKTMVPRLNAKVQEVQDLTKGAIAQRAKVQALSSSGADGRSLMKTIVMLFKMLKEVQNDELRLRAVREQLRACVSETVQRIELFPVGRTLGGSKDDRHIDITFISGAERRIDVGEC